MAATQPFTWGANGQAISPEQLERQRKVAEALMAVQPKPQTMWEGIQSAIGQIGGSALDARADAQEKQAQDDYLDEFDALGDAPSTQQLEKLVGNSFANPGQQAVVQALLSQQMQQQSPDYQLGLDEKRANIAAMGTTPGYRWNADHTAMEPIPGGAADPANPLNASKVDTFAPIGADEAKTLGLPPGAYQRNTASGEIKQVGGGGTNVSVNMGENTGAFGKASDEAAAKRFDAYVQAGNDATGFTSDLNSLKDIAGRVSTGKTAEIEASLGPYAQALGIDISGLGDLQAYQSIVDKLAPQMRVPGAGASSDFDARQFLSSLPGLGKTPEGNQIIIDTFQAVQDRKIKAADIASKAYLPKEQGGVTWQEAERQIAALPDPFTAFKQAKTKGGTVAGDTSTAAPGTVPAAEPPVGAPPVGAVMDGYRFKGGDPAVQSNWEKL